MEIMGPIDLCMIKWVIFMSRYGDGLMMSCTPTFFRWLDKYILTVEDYKYIGKDFSNYHNIVLHEGMHCDDIGKTSHFGCFILFNFFQVFMLF